MNIKAKKCSEIRADVRAAVKKWPEFAEDAGLPEVQLSLSIPKPYNKLFLRFTVVCKDISDSEFQKV